MNANRDGGVLANPSEWRATRHPMRHTDLPEDAVGRALERTTDWLLSRQTEEGYWVAELEGDTILESEYILLRAFLGQESNPVCNKLARYIQDHQLEEGGWAIYPGGPVDVSASVKAYFALKLVGIDPGDGAMERARAGDPRRRGARTSATASRGFIWRCWARLVTTSARVFRRSWC